MRWGLIGSAVLLMALALVWLVRSPWVSAEVTPIETVDGWLHLKLGLTNHGYGDFGRKIVNVLVPDNVGIGRVEGARSISTAGIINAPGESIDGVHGSRYWNEVVDLIQGAQLFSLAVSTDRQRVPIRIRIGTPRRDLTVDLRKTDEPHEVRFATVRAWIEPRVRGWPLIGRGGTW